MKINISKLPEYSVKQTSYVVFKGSEPPGESEKKNFEFQKNSSCRNFLTRIIDKTYNALQAIVNRFVVWFKTFIGSAGWKNSPQCGALQRQYDPASPIRNFYKVDSSLYRGAQPGITAQDRLDEAALKKGLLYLRDRCHVRTILNLRNESDLRPEFQEAPKDHQSVEKRSIEAINAKASPRQQITYINIPIRSGQAIQPQQFMPILSVLQKASPHQAVFVHCKAGVDRTGLVSSLYRALRYPETPFADIYAEMQSCGHDAQGTWKGYVSNIAYYLSSQPIFKDYYRMHKQQIDSYC